MRKLVIALLVLVGLLVAADFGAAAVAESAVSRQMREQLKLPDDPSVRINGFPFLTQALFGHYGNVHVEASRISYGKFQQLQVSAELNDVTAPLSMLLGSGPKSLQVGQVAGTVRVGAGDLERLVPAVKHMRIESIDTDTLRRVLKDGGDPSLAQLDPERSARIVGTITDFGQEDEIAVIAVLELSGGKARIVPRDVRLADGTPLPIDKSLQRALLSRFTVPIDAGTLPLQVVPTTFRARNGLLALVLGATTTG